jgi:phosphatidate cytidylyltransferase
MLFKRIVTVLIGAPFVIGAILAPTTWVFKTFVLGCLLFALIEFFTIIALDKQQKTFAVILGVLHTAFLLFCPDPARWQLFELCLIVLVSFSYYCVAPKETAEGIGPKIALTTLGILYIGTFGSLVGLLRERPYGIFWVFALLAMTWLNDTSAYFFGHKFGRHKLAPKISPGKTVEGFFGGYLGTLAGFLLFWTVCPNDLPLWKGLIVTVLVGVFGPVGDLSESLIKRSFHVKDSGNIIPGHGGMLDRIDALLFTAPIVYFFAALAR